MKIPYGQARWVVALVVLLMPALTGCGGTTSIPSGDSISGTVTDHHGPVAGALVRV